MLIKDMVEIYSPTGSEEKLVDFIIQWANNNGFKAYKDEVGNFVAEKGSGREVLLVGHVDTIPGEIKVNVENGKLYGRGAVDAKGALACFLEAANAVNKGKIIVIGAVDEEGESKGARNILNKFNPEFIIVGEPSGWSNLNMGYKGTMNMYYVNERGKEHGSSSDKNCYEEAIDFYDSLKNYCNSFNQGKSLFDQLGLKLSAINSGDDGFKESIELAINFRIPIGFDLENLKNFVDENRGKAGIKYSSVEKPVKADKGNKLVSSFIKAIRSTGGEVKFKLKSGTSDMNVLQDYKVPMVTYGPGDFNLEHTPNEHLDLEDYEKAIKILKMVLEEI
jgi:LysW-gamma-L-lysine carboxypeptidase